MLYIYIDPPYGKDKMGDFAKTNYDNAITRDNLLSMLYPRLLIAKRLLNNDSIQKLTPEERDQLADTLRKYEPSSVVRLLNTVKSRY